MNIVCLSGGKASAWCAHWALSNFEKKDVLLYFNDVKWEHPDLYRFLTDLEKYFDKKITYDSDGRSPEDIFYKEGMLANDRVPFCSRILKAERLQKFYAHGDTLIFGIGPEEERRAPRIRGVYEKFKKKCAVLFPLIQEKITKSEVDAWLKKTGIEEPLLYKLGFSHNNCSGGCVRSGKKNWIRLLKKLPEVYKERERVEEDFFTLTGKRGTFLKNESLKELRIRYENGKLSKFYDMDDGKEVSECIGICNFNN